MANVFQDPLKKDDLEGEKKFFDDNRPVPVQENSAVYNDLNANLETSQEIPAASQESARVEARENALMGEIEETREKKETSETISETPHEKIEETRKKLDATLAVAPEKTDIASIAESISGTDDFAQKIEKLLKVAEEKGPMRAIEVARHMDSKKDFSAQDNYTMDELHDALHEDAVRAELIKRGLLKEI
jgi:hypothetical protein